MTDHSDDSELAPTAPAHPEGEPSMSRESGKRPIFVLSTQSKSKKQLKAEAREVLRKYQEAQRAGQA